MENNDINEIEESKETKGGYTGFVLLNTKTCKWNKLKNSLRREWEIDTVFSISNEVLTLEIDGISIMCALIQTPVPDGEAVKYAQYNYTWKDAKRAAESHVAHLVIAVMGGDDLMKRQSIYAKVTAAAAGLSNAVGVYQYPTVHEPEYYIEGAKLLKKGEFPILNFVYVGMYTRDGKFNAYTVGMRAFGIKDFEVIQTNAEPMKLHSFMTTVADYVVTRGLELKEGEKISVEFGREFDVELSDGVSIGEPSFKIAYYNE